VHVPPEACGGVRHVVAACPEGVETARAAQDRDCLLLRFASQEEARARARAAAPPPLPAAALRGP